MSSIKGDLAKLIDPAVVDKTFSPAPAVGGRAAQGAVAWPGSSSGGGGAFDELDYASREYWTTVDVHSTDGLLTIQERPIKSILLTDGSRARFKEPV